MWPNLAALHQHTHFDNAAYIDFAHALDSALQKGDKAALRATFDGFANLNRETMMQALATAEAKSQEGTLQMMRTLIIPSIIVVIFILGGATLMATAPALVPEITAPIPTSVRIREVSSESVLLRVHSQGNVMPSTESQLIPEVSGKITWMSPKLVAGGYFQENEVLVRVDDLDYRNTLNRAKASLTRASAEQQHAQFEFCTIEKSGRT